MSITILAIESSCDETSASIVKDGKVLSNAIFSQSIHELYGGVVPELASRAHQQAIIKIVNKSMRSAEINLKELSAIAFTQGPGLLGALLVGISFAKGLAIALGIPLISVNHMQAHILAHFIKDPKPAFPFLCLTVSGGHTQLVLVRDYLVMEIIGETQDDAVGEAFDKSAKMLGLPYPGGHLIDKYAKNGDPNKFDFPKTSMPGLNYSFSGIKTAILYFLREKVQADPNFISENLQDLSASIQHTLIEMLLEKLVIAAETHQVKQIAIAGGVAANSRLRSRLYELSAEKKWEIFLPDLEYCTDNAAMIGMAGYFKYLNADFANLSATPDARLKI